MSKAYIGKIVNTHGIKGELKILSDFELKDLVFKKGVKLIINNKEYEIESYRHHKVFDMVIFKGFYNINDVLFLKNALVYVDRSILDLADDDYLLNDLIGADLMLDNNKVGFIKDYISGKNPLLECVNSNNKKFYIPYNDEFINGFDKENNIVYLNDISKGVL